MTMINVKRAGESDALALYELARRTFIDTFAEHNSEADMDLYLASTFSPSKQLREIQDPQRRIAIAWIDNAAAGFFHLLDVAPDLAVKGARPIELLRLYVDSPWHGKGVGAVLMDKSLELAREEGFQTMWLGVWEQNFRAQAFYRKYGFTVVGEHIFKLGNDEQTDLIMERAI